MTREPRELQFTTQQFVGVILSILALGIFVFLLGISIGKKHTALTAAAGGPGMKSATEIPAAGALRAEAGKSDIQKELDKHAQAAGADSGTAKPEPKITSPSGGGAAPKTAEVKPAHAPAGEAAGKGKETKTDSRDVLPKTKADPAVGGTWYVQVAAVTDKPAASAFAAKLEKDGFPAVLVEPLAKDRVPTFRVRVGPFVSKAQAEEAKTRLAGITKKKKIDFFLVRG